MKPLMPLLSACICLTTSLGFSHSAVARLGHDGRQGNWTTSLQGSPDPVQCERSVKADPTNAEAHNDLGWALRQHGDLVGAERELREAISLNPHLSQAYSNLSVVLLDRNQPNESVEKAKMAVKLDDKQAIYHVVLGNALYRMKNLTDATCQYQEALRLHPDYENALYHLGRCLMDSAERTQAKVTLSRALKLDPSDARVVQLLDQLFETTESGQARASAASITESPGATGRDNR